MDVAEVQGAIISDNGGFTRRKVTPVSLFQIVKPTCGTLCAEGTCRRAQNALPVPREEAVQVPEAEHARSYGTAASAACKSCCLKCPLQPITIIKVYLNPDPL